MITRNVFCKPKLLRFFPFLGEGDKRTQRRFGFKNKDEFKRSTVNLARFAVERFIITT